MAVDTRRHDLRHDAQQPDPFPRSQDLRSRTLAAAGFNPVAQVHRGVQ